MPNIFINGEFSCKFLTEGDEAIADSLSTTEDDACCELQLGRFVIPFNQNDLVSGSFNLTKSDDAQQWDLSFQGTFKLPVKAKVISAFDDFNNKEDIRIVGLDIGDRSLEIEGADHNGIPAGLAISKTKPKST